MARHELGQPGIVAADQHAADDAAIVVMIEHLDSQGARAEPLAQCLPRALGARLAALRRIDRRDAHRVQRAVGNAQQQRIAVEHGGGVAVELAAARRGNVLCRHR